VPLLFTCRTARDPEFLRQRGRLPLIISCKNSKNSENGEALSSKNRLVFEIRIDPGRGLGPLQLKRERLL
jgi:hypothetical protein